MEKLNEICKQVHNMHVVKLTKWYIILQHDYRNMHYKKAIELAKIVSGLHSFEDTEAHFKSRGLLNEI